MEYGWVAIVRMFLLNLLGVLAAGAFAGMGAKWLLRSIGMAQEKNSIVIGVICSFIAAVAGFIHGDMTIPSEVIALVGESGDREPWVRIIAYLALGFAGWFLYMHSQGHEQ